ncbi:MAG: hypothetical protein H0Z32_10995 [Bacillaceae bacterium]|nr:hypothetical protein [Bacillaceae bacterium]MBO8156976.1 hypothetical protein [Bacillaceae bacterium]
MNIAVNEILQDVRTQETFRVLWIDPGNVICYLIDIDRENNKALPFKRKVSDVIDDLIQEELIKIKEDPYSSIGTQMDEKDIRIRENAWNVIKDMVQDEPAIYEKKYVLST